MSTPLNARRLSASLQVANNSLKNLQCALQGLAKAAQNLREAWPKKNGDKPTPAR